MRSVTIPDGVEELGFGAFEGCAELKTVTIPDSVTKIGDDLFRDCPALEQVVVGEGSFAERYCAENGIPYGYRGAA